MTHPSETLWAAHHPPAGYPAGVLAVPEPIRGLAFFPGGYGLWGVEPAAPLPAFPVGGVMVVGHDFHSEAGYRASLRRGGENPNQPTWRNLCALFEQASVPMDRCFFTNLYMGLRAGTQTTGLFPGAADKVFSDHCSRFLVEQIRAQRPELIITLGVHVPPVLGRLAPALAPWAMGRGIKHLDSVGAIVNGVTFDGVLDFSTAVLALIHPSLRHASLRHRRYGAKVGAAAELALIKDGLARAGSG